VTGYEEFDATRIKHMEMIQAVVARLAGNSSLVKGWAITLTAAFLGFAVNEDDTGLAVAALVPIFFFFFLDASYLRSERLFRDLFDQVRSGSGVEPFDMRATSKDRVGDRTARLMYVLKTLARPTLWGFYGLLATAVAIVGAVIR
jgi:hypothetical protein